MSKPKVAIVADWLTNMGGAERVVYELHKMYPEAPIYTSSYDPDKMPLFKKADVRTSFIQKLPYGKKHQLWPVLRRFYFGNLKLKGYDLVISSSGAEAKAVRAPDGVHINYCHSPTHYYWVRPDEYKAAESAGGKFFRLGLKVLTPWMKSWDYKVAQRPDFMVCNSTITQKRIKKFYKRDAKIIFPPIDTERFSGYNFDDRKGYMISGRQVHYKRHDIVVEAFKKLGLPLRVTGKGPEHDNLLSIADGVKNISFEYYSDKQLAIEVASSRGYIFPGVEDFGIVAAESIAAGTPVISINDGGAPDIIQEGVNGLFFEKQTVESVVSAIKNFEKQTFDNDKIKLEAKKFDTTVFVKSMTKFIKEHTLTTK